MRSAALLLALMDLIAIALAVVCFALLFALLEGLERV